MNRHFNPADDRILEWDEEFKSIITRKKILAWIVKLTIPMFRDIEVNVIAAGIRSDGERHVKVENTFIPTRGGSTAILDSVFEMDIEVDGSVVPIVVGIEHQNDPDPGYPLVVRMQYYAAKMFGRQKHRKYRGLRQSFSVWLLPDPHVSDRGRVDLITMGRHTADGSMEPLEQSMVNAVAVNLGTEGEDEESILDFLSVFFMKGCRAHTEEGFSRFKERYLLEDEDLSLDEVEQLSSLFQDSKERYTRESRVETIIEGVSSLVKKGVMGIDDAIDLFEMPEDQKPLIKSAVLERLQQNGC